MSENNKNNYFIEKIKIKYEWIQNEATSKLSSIFLELIKKEEKRINDNGLKINDEPFELLKKFDEMFLNIEFKSNVLVKYLCLYDPSIKINLYLHIDFLIEKILKELDYPFTIIGNPTSQEKTFKVAFRVHNIGKLLIPKILFDKNVILEDGDKLILEKQIFYTKEILETLKFEKQILDICLDVKNNINECYLSDMKKCNASKISRLVLILDKYFALISDKPYRKNFSKTEAIDIIREDIEADEDNTKILDVIKHNI